MGSCPIDPECGIHNEFMPWAGIHHAQMDARRCTCGHEDSDGRGDVLDCPVHRPGAAGGGDRE